MSHKENVQKLSADEVREAVRENYGQVAQRTVSSAACCGSTSSCCGPVDETSQSASADEVSAALGYSSDELAGAPEGSNLGLGCGNPQAIASLKPGEVVLDLGSGAGFDSFLAARAVGGSGRVIGVDMTPEMIKKLVSTSGRAS